ncbi:hypothetical protein M5D96_011794 [Drosophila gunungcola]|uniref:Uncharacterized protein n=1 Tax=Drosophila gunungcola TaxID=103775 RepID=A0A9Q0BKQ3_9MUSC|nr:hypothetical protein M5D96_011794 [Drosophila gunungcola]
MPIPEDAESLGNTYTNSNSSPDQQNVPISTVPPSSSTPAFTAIAGTSGGIVKSITMNEPIATESGKATASNKFTRKRERVCNNSS